MEQNDDLLNEIKRELERQALSLESEDAATFAPIGCCIISIAGGSTSQGGLTRDRCQATAQKYPGASFEFREGEDC